MQIYNMIKFQIFWNNFKNTNHDIHGHVLSFYSKSTNTRVRGYDFLENYMQMTQPLLFYN